MLLVPPLDIGATDIKDFALRYDLDEWKLDPGCWNNNNLIYKEFMRKNMGSAERSRNLGGHGRARGMLVWTNRPPPSGEDWCIYSAGTVSLVSWRVAHSDTHMFHICIFIRFERSLSYSPASDYTYEMVKRSPHSSCWCVLKRRGQRER